MSDFEKYWEENASKESWANKAVAWNIWKEKQAIIDQLNSVLDERTKEWLQAIELGAYFENVAKPLKEENDRLKAQLNNMEACYIEKKKRVDELEGALNEVKEWKSHPVGHETSFGSWGVRDFYRGLAEKALRGAND